jgi:PAP2 superfamily protein
VQTVGLSWQHSFEAAAAVAAGGAALRLSPRRSAQALGAFAREVAVIGVLYAVWQLAGDVSGASTNGALARARWIEHVEHYLPLPSERTVQHAVLGHPIVVQGANLYYAAMHMTTMLIFLIWLFVRHRDRYKPIRQVMAWTTLGCLLVQLIPVAPPRMLPGIVDTGLAYDQSVYSHGLAVDQLSAMPSVHVAWAVLVGWYVWRVSASRWHVIGPVHAVLMTLAVVVTGNHFWLDGIVAVAILVACAYLVARAHAALASVRVRIAERQAAHPRDKQDLSAVDASPSADRGSSSARRCAESARQAGSLQI